MKTPVIRATINDQNQCYQLTGQALDDNCILVDCRFSTKSVIEFEHKISQIKSEYDCQIVREFKA
jgi:hypothetical protein